jgi:hypothetical protein
MREVHWEDWMLEEGDPVDRVRIVPVWVDHRNFDAALTCSSERRKAQGEPSDVGC